MPPIGTVLEAAKSGDGAHVALEVQNGETKTNRRVRTIRHNDVRVDRVIWDVPQHERQARVHHFDGVVVGVPVSAGKEVGEKRRGS